MKITIKDYNCEIGEESIFEREETAQEKTERETYQANYKALQAEEEAKPQAKATAEAKLAALGLTTEDLKALGL